MSKEGCPFCRGENTARFDGDNLTGLTLEFDFEEEQTYIVAFGFNSSGKETEVKLPIGYCPICARELNNKNKGKQRSKLR